MFELLMVVNIEVNTYSKSTFMLVGHAMSVSANLPQLAVECDVE